MEDRRDILDFGASLAAQAVVGSINVTAGVVQFGRDVHELVSGLVRITAPDGPLDRLADLADELRPLIRDVATISDSLHRLVALTDSLARLADSLERLSHVGDTLPRLTDRAGALPEMVSLTRDVERRVSQIASRLDSLGPHVGTLAGTIGDLQQSVRVLGGTIGPLQGTAERVGRLIERFPGSRRRPGEETPGTDGGDSPGADGTEAAPNASGR